MEPPILPPTPIPEPFVFKPHPQMVRMEKIDPNDYPFRHHIKDDKEGHKCIVETIDEHYKGREHLFCDKEQLRDGKFRLPKKLQEAKTRGFQSVLEMNEADKKKVEEEKEKQTTDLQKQVADLTALVQQLLKK